MRKGILFVLLFTAIFVFSGVVDCAEPVQYSGFLQDYPTFEKGMKGVNMHYIKEGVIFKQYKKIMLDQVTFYLKDDAKYKGINPDEIKFLSDLFAKAFIDALNDAYPLKDTPGPDVMRIRVAITDLESSKPGVRTHSTIIPVGKYYSLVSKRKTGEYPGIGSASMEAEFLDSVSNERIAAAIDRRPGRKNDVGKFSAAKSAFEFWAKRLKEFLDDSR